MTTPDLRGASVTWLSAILDSADVSLIGVTNWWPRATSALETAATEETYGAAVTRACKKLGIEALTARSSEQLQELEPMISEHFSEWQQIVTREDVYIIALARITRKLRANRKETTK